MFLCQPETGVFGFDFRKLALGVDEIREQVGLTIPGLDPVEHRSEIGATAADDLPGPAVVFRQSKGSMSIGFSY